MDFFGVRGSGVCPLTDGDTVASGAIEPTGYEPLDPKAGWATRTILLGRTDFWDSMFWDLQEEKGNTNAIGADKLENL